MWSYLSYARQFLKCNAQNAFFIGIKASFPALVGISCRRIHRLQLDLLSIPNYVIKTERPHGNRHGKTEEQREHFIAHNLRKRCIKENFFEGIHDRFHFVTRNSELIELKKYASRWTRWRRNISPVACRPTSI